MLGPRVQVERRDVPLSPLPVMLLAIVAVITLGVIAAIPRSGTAPAAQPAVPAQVTPRPSQPSTQAPPAAEPKAEQSRPPHPGVRALADGSLKWDRPRATEGQKQRDDMVEQQIKRPGLGAEAIRDERVLEAMRAVPRHWFVPDSQRRRAYDDSPLPIGHGQTISQPYIVALMTDLLKLKPGDKVLEIGTGSGYQAAVLSELTPYVFTIEVVEPLHKQAAERFKDRGYKTILSRLGDGYDGWPAHAPFDAIIVTCAAGHVPTPLWEQLRPGGRMVIPIGGTHEVQRLVLLTKKEDGGRESRTVLPVRFVPMTGKSQEK
jgi:protein-L-isoaspartate(D-aspartate) O-methyltransferase